MKPSSRRSGDSSSARSGGTIVTWLQTQLKFGDALGLGALERQRRRGRGGLEADREEHDLAVGVLLGDPQRVERRVDHPHVGARRLGLEQRPVRARDAHHVAEAGEDDAGLVRDRDPVVDAPHRDHAHRAAGPVDELDVLRQQVVDPVLVDRVGVAAAHLHDLVVAAGLDRRQDLAGEHPAELGVAELVDELHASTWSAVPACTSRRSPSRTGSTSAISTLARVAVLVLAERQRADLVDPHDAHRHRVVAAGDADVVVAVAHSITLARSSASSCS